ncbi:lipopolysaccharide biosynthesis protein [Desulfospira joergensenii]|uniref:lipopolysaccharide biosynthesis protein n=1 Tax=Desulfospira joergensenii TaxID=53329 RepID=UPI0003B3124E|nr:lipopolysaccharide biosynthesis protein [Desulfospira joergensenii]
MNIKRAFLSGSLWTLTGNTGHQLINFAIFVYLARELSPRTFGIMAMAIAFTEIATIICRFGQTNAIVRLEKTHERVLSTAFWIICGWGVALTLLISALSGIISNFYGEPDLKRVLLWLAPLPALSTIGAVHEAILRRHMKFHFIATKNITAMIVSGTLSIILVHLDYGIEALIGQRLSFAIISSVSILLFARWRPRMIFDKKESVYLISHGKSVVYNVLSNRLSPRLTDMIVGYFLGVYALGLLRIANQMFEFISITIIHPVSDVLPAVFRHYQNDKKKLGVWYLKLSQIAAIVIFPAFTGMAVLSDELIFIAFGDQWAGSAIILQVLCIMFFLVPMIQFAPPTMMAIGDMIPVTRLAFAKIILIGAVVTILSHYEIVHVVIGLVIVQYLITIGYFRVLTERIPGLWPNLLIEALPPLLSAGAMCITVLWFHHIGPFSEINNIYLKLICSILAGVLSYSFFLLIGDVSGLWRGTVRRIYRLAEELLNR